MGGAKRLFSENWHFMASFWQIGIFGRFSCVLMLREATIKHPKGEGGFPDLGGEIPLIKPGVGG